MKLQNTPASGRVSIAAVPDTVNAAEFQLIIDGSSQSQRRRGIHNEPRA